jgi:hypothetical protein
MKTATDCPNGYRYAGWPCGLPTSTCGGDANNVRRSGLGAATRRRQFQGKAAMKKYQLLVVVVMLGLTWPAIARAEDQPIEVQLVDAMNKVFGVHPGFRANHAKGIVA